MVTVITESALRRWRRRIGWLVLIWFTSVLALAILAGIFRYLMTSVGLSPSA